MNNKIIILGKSNASVAIILEILKSNNYEGCVTIIENMLNIDNLKYETNDKNIKINKLNSDDYKFCENDTFILGALRPTAKLQIYNYFNKQYNNNLMFCDMLNVIASTAFIASTTQLGKGCIISHNCTIDAHSILGNFFSMNRNSSVGHHTIIGNFVTINPGSHIAGNCEIGDNVQIGMGVIIIDGIKIGNNSVIGAGSLIIKNVPENVTVYGSPAKIIKQNVDL